jgi:hypothetical protein
MNPTLTGILLNLLTRLTSRKFLVSATGFVTVLILPLDTQTQAVIMAGIAMVYVAVEGLVDFHSAPYFLAQSQSQAAEAAAEESKPTADAVSTMGFRYIESED